MELNRKMSSGNIHCVLCGLVFEDRSHLAIHQTSEHKITPVKRTMAASDRKAAKVRKEIKRDNINGKNIIEKLKCFSPRTKACLVAFNGRHRYKCHLCKNKFTCEEDLKGHLKKFHNIFKKLSKPVYACGLCSAKFYYKSFLKKHVELHAPPKKETAV